MRIMLAILLSCAAWLTGAPVMHGESLPPKRVRLSGEEYVHLGAWGRANEFVIHWLDRDKLLQLSQRRARLKFNMNSRLSEINGVNVWLCSPLLYRGGKAYISQLDLEKTIAPLLSPPAYPSGIRLRTVCLDPGHGGKDPGNRVRGKEEQKYTLLLARELRYRLDQAGFKVVLTRNADTYVDLAERTALAKKHKADLFVSLHFNSTDSSPNEVKGIETYCLTPVGATSTNAHGEGNTRWVTGNRNDEKSMVLAYQVQKALTDELSSDDRGVRRARFQVLREAQMPAILIEGGFMSNPAESNKIFDPAHRRQMARAILDGILAYKRLVHG